MREPSSQQLKAITHVRGPAGLIAGPGSGKTFTIVSRIVNLIESNRISPDHILVVTFSKAAAKEMQERFFKESGQTGVHFGTFHSVAFHLLKESFSFREDALISDVEKRRVLAQVLKNHGQEALCTGELLARSLSALSRYKNTGDYGTDGGIREELSGELFDVVMKEYAEFLREMGKLDFDDMISECLRALMEHPQILNKYQSLFQFVLVDEFQDINEPQYQLVRLLAAPEDHLFVVGDDDQAIYGFRGSSPGVMQRFFTDYPEARKLMLTENYRSGDRIVTFASHIIAQNKNRFPKEFHPMMRGGEVRFYRVQTHKEEEDLLLSCLKGLSAEALKRSALIVRTNRELALFQRALKDGALPVRAKQKEASVFTGEVAEDLLSFLRFVFEGHHRTDFLRFMNKPNRYLQRAALFNETVTLSDLLRYYDQNAEMKQELSAFWEKLRLAEKMRIPYAVSLYRKTIGYDRYLKERAKSPEEAKRLLAEADAVMRILEAYREPERLSDFWAFAEKRERTDKLHKEKSDAAAEDAQSGSDAFGIRILTMHQSKGLEFDHVFIPDLNEGNLPSKKSIGASLEEERRLLYVAVTRARLSLTLLATEERNRDVSRFIKGLLPDHPAQAKA